MAVGGADVVGSPESVGSIRRRRVALGLVVTLALFWLVGGWLYAQGGHGEVVWRRLWWPTIGAGLMGLTAYAITRATTGFQLLARAVLLAQVITPLLHGASILGARLILVGGAALALVLLGRQRLGPDGGPFAPLRLRGLLIAVIVLYGALAYSWLSPAIELLPVFVSDIPFRPVWEFEIARVAVGAGFLVAAIGLYHLRTIALLAPVAIGTYFVVRGLAGQVSYRAHETGMTRMVSDEVAWGSVRTGAVISLTIAPIVLALLYLRSRSDRGGSLSPPRGPRT